MATLTLGDCVFYTVYFMILRINGYYFPVKAHRALMPLMMVDTSFCLQETKACCWLQCH
jgi:hypothetical protein